MRTKRAVPARRRRPLGAAVAAGLILLTAAAVAGCSSSNSSSSAASSPAAAFAGAAAPAASAAASAPAGSGSGQAVSAADIVPSGRQLIYTAQLTVRAADVAAAISRATSVVAAAGGYVSAENAAAGDGDGQQSQASATITFKIPVAAYASTLAALSGGGLGTQLSLSQQAQDVTQQVADVASRVASDQAAIAQLRALLARAGSVGSLLTVQDQINTEETDLESMLAQRSALDHETAYATVTLTLVGPKAVVKPAVKKPAPPSGLTGGLARGWHGLRMTAGWLLTVGGIVAPFAAALAVIAALAWWIRRRLIRFRRERRPAQ